MALLLASIGIYGVMAYTFSQRNSRWNRVKAAVGDSGAWQGVERCRPPNRKIAVVHAGLRFELGIYS